MAAEHAFAGSSTSGTTSVTVFKCWHLPKILYYLLTGMLGLRWIKFPLCNFAHAQIYLDYIVARMRRTGALE